MEQARSQDFAREGAQPMNEGAPIPPQQKSTKNVKNKLILLNYPHNEESNNFIVWMEELCRFLYNLTSFPVTILNYQHVSVVGMAYQVAD